MGWVTKPVALITIKEKLYLHQQWSVCHNGVRFDPISNKVIDKLRCIWFPLTTALTRGWMVVRTERRKNQANWIDHKLTPTRYLCNASNQRREQQQQQHNNPNGRTHSLVLFSFKWFVSCYFNDSTFRCYLQGDRGVISICLNKRNPAKTMRHTQAHTQVDVARARQLTSKWMFALQTFHTASSFHVLGDLRALCYLKGNLIGA